MKTDVTSRCIHCGKFDTLSIRFTQNSLEFRCTNCNEVDRRGFC